MDWHYNKLHSNFRTSRSWQMQILAMSEMNLKQKITFVALFQVTYALFQVHVTLQRRLNNSGMAINSKV